MLVKARTKKDKLTVILDRVKFDNSISINLHKQLESVNDKVF